MGSNERKTEKMHNLQPRIISSNSTLNETDSYFTEQHGSDGWVDLFFLVFLVAFTFYSPVLICLFFSTLVTENGLRQIVLEGASPVSFRSLEGNYFYSGSDTIGWHKVRMLIFPLVALPLPFLPMAKMAHSFLLQYRGRNEILMVNLPNQFMVISITCYGVLFLYNFFTFKTSQPAVEAERSTVCSILDFNFTCFGGEPPQQVWHHLRMQPLILVKCWSFFRKYLVNYFKMSLIILPRSRKMSPF